jgi:GntR family transcriptional repressor for pyruvate dehydrogenase complex
MQTDRNDYEKLVDYIEERIVKGQLRGGDKIPSERDLSGRLGISRGSVRSGLAILEGIGIVENRHGSGNYIADQSDRKLVQILTMMYTLDQMSPEDIRIFRYACELQALALAVQNIGPEQKEKLRACLHIMETGADEEEKTRADQIIHQTIVEASESRLVIANYLALSGVLGRFVRAVREDVREKGLIQERQFQRIHRRLVAALCNGDFEGAKKALDEHFAYVRTDAGI